MHPFVIHILILLPFAVFGLMGFIGAYMAPETHGGLFGRYDFIIVYWVIYGGYVLGSTIIVGLVAFVQYLRSVPFTRLSVVLSHVIPIGLIWLFLSLGVHDWIEGMWKKNDHTFEQQRSGREPAESKRAPIPATPRVTKPGIKSSSGIVEQQQLRTEE